MHHDGKSAQETVARLAANDTQFRQQIHVYAFPPIISASTNETLLPSNKGRGRAHARIARDIGMVGGRDTVAFHDDVLCLKRLCLSNSSNRDFQFMDCACSHGDSSQKNFEFVFLFCAVDNCKR